MILFALGIIGFVVFMIVKTVSQSEMNASAPEQRFKAAVAAKRTEVFGGENAHTRYYATFELPNGERMELSMNGRQYGALAEGDTGILTRKGSSFVSFARMSSRFTAASASANAAVRNANANAWHKCRACGATYRGPVCDYCGTPARTEEEY